VKLRLTPGSVRLRLSAAEVQDLAARGTLEDRVVLDPSGRALVYGVEVSPESTGAPSVTFDDEHLLVRIPPDLAAAWLAGREEGVIADIPGTDAPLRITVETDRAG